MIERILGRTGLRVSILGMGTGGNDPLGEKRGRSDREMVALLHRAFDLGINLFDTSPGYGTASRSERILGHALRELPREQVVVTTKVALAGGHSDRATVMKPHEVIASVEASLKRLDLSEIDVLLIAVASSQYFRAVMDELAPTLCKLKEQGKVRFLGSSEQTRSDGAHEWLRMALHTGLFDVAMLGHNMVNQSAQEFVLPYCHDNEIGVMNVFTVRNLFSNPIRLQEVLTDLRERRLITLNVESETSPLAWLLDGDVQSLVEAAYRFAAYTEGVTTVMCGTIDPDKLRQNVDTILKGPLPTDKIDLLREYFSHVAEPVGN